MSPRLEALALRAIVAIVALMAVVTPIAIIYVQLTDDDDDESSVSAQQTSDDGEDSAATASDESSESEDPSESEEESSASSTTTSTTTSTTSTTEAADVPDLPAADAAQPPVEPFGVYRDGKVTLAGSVPRAEVAAGYTQRLASVLGPDNITLQMSIDPRVSGETMRIDVDERFQFPTGQITFDPEFEALLGLGAAALRLLPETTLVVTGHTDAIGTDATNVALSMARAQLVVDFMVQNGIPAERVVARGAGEAEPIADNNTPEGRQANRRIEATLEGLRPTAP